MARARNRRTKVPARRLILDSGAAIASARGDARARALMTRALEVGLDVRMPVAVLAETLRGNSRDAPVHRVRNAVDVFPTDERTARVAGGLLGGPGVPITADALVAAEAIVAAGDVLTSDADDLRALLAAKPSASVIAL